MGADFSLKNKVALITGGSRGIGEAIALTFAENGAHCILVSRKIEALEGVVQKIEDKGGSSEAIACNVGDIEQIDSPYLDKKSNVQIFNGALQNLKEIKTKANK